MSLFCTFKKTPPKMKAIMNDNWPHVKAGVFPHSDFRKQVRKLISYKFTLICIRKDCIEQYSRRVLNGNKTQFDAKYKYILPSSVEGVESVESKISRICEDLKEPLRFMKVGTDIGITIEWIDYLIEIVASRTNDLRDFQFVSLADRQSKYASRQTFMSIMMLVVVLIQLLFFVLQYSVMRKELKISEQQLKMAQEPINYNEYIMKK